MRPIAMLLSTLCFLLPVAALPNVEFPAIFVQAGQPGGRFRGELRRGTLFGAVGSQIGHTGAGGQVQGLSTNTRSRNFGVR